MAALPYMQFSVSEYLADTTHLEALEHGAYLMLLFHYWQTGKPLPNDDTYLARAARVRPEQWPAVRTLVERLFNTSSTEWQHARLEVELLDAQTRVDNASKGGKASAAARKRKAIKDRKARTERAAADLNARSTHVEQPCNKEEEEEVCSKEHTKTPVAVATALPEFLNADAWMEWVNYRREAKKKLTPSTISKQHKFLSAFDKATQAIVINQSITNGWAGLFEPKPTGGFHVAPNRPATAAERMRAELARLESS